MAGRQRPEFDKAGGLTEALALAAEAKRRGFRIMAGGAIFTRSGDGSGDKRLGPVREAIVSCANSGLVPVVLEGEKFR